MGVVNNSSLYQGQNRIRKRFCHLGPNPKPNTNDLRPNSKIFFLLLIHLQQDRFLFITPYLMKSLGIWANNEQIQIKSKPMSKPRLQNPNLISNPNSMLSNLNHLGLLHPYLILTPHTFSATVSIIHSRQAMDMNWGQQISLSCSHIRSKLFLCLRSNPHC